MADDGAGARRDAAPWFEAPHDELALLAKPMSVVLVMEKIAADTAIISKMMLVIELHQEPYPHHVLRLPHPFYRRNLRTGAGHEGVRKPDTMVSRRRTSVLV